MILFFVLSLKFVSTVYSFDIKIRSESRASEMKSYSILVLGRSLSAIRLTHSLTKWSQLWSIFCSKWIFLIIDKSTSEAWISGANKSVGKWKWNFSDDSNYLLPLNFYFRILWRQLSLVAVAVCVRCSICECVVTLN